MNKPKVLLIQESLMNYRDPIYSLISKKVDLTVAYTIKADYTDSDYPIISLPYKKIGKIIWHIGLRKIINKYDVVIFVPHFKMIRLAMLPFLPHKPKLVTWSIGIHVSYNREYNLSTFPSLSDKIYEYIQDHADACIFYMKAPIEYWKKYNDIDERKYFVAHNTVKVDNCNPLLPICKRNTILFVGTLYKQKGIGELIEAYSKAYINDRNILTLVIIGKGPEEDAILEQIIANGLQEKVKLVGAIYDEKELSKYFHNARLCISPKQAGLTVLKSLGYGVPFVTRSNAITGGEKSNILHNENGLFYDSIKDLVEIINECSKNPARFDKMSIKAYEYYQTNATPERMAKGVLDAIRYVLK